MSELEQLKKANSELLALARTISTFGGNLQQAKALADKVLKSLGE